jgi:monoamine oxidase
MTSRTASIEPVVVIGADVAGLTAAQRLKQAGMVSLVLEARQRPGGRISTDRQTGSACECRLRLPE